MAEKRMVLVFVFSEDYRGVLLINKNDRWQDGAPNVLNGLGGKLEPGETFRDAVIRKVAEESGISDLHSVSPFAVMRCENSWVVHCFSAVSPRVINHGATEHPSGVVCVYPTDHHLYRLNEVRPDVHWLIELALDKNPHKGMALINYTQ